MHHILFLDWTILQIRSSVCECVHAVCLADACSVDSVPQTHAHTPDSEWVYWADKEITYNACIERCDTVCWRANQLEHNSYLLFCVDEFQHAPISRATSSLITHPPIPRSSSVWLHIVYNFQYKTLAYGLPFRSCHGSMPHLIHDRFLKNSKRRKICSRSGWIRANRKLWP